jgi:hypothetical protein
MRTRVAALVATILAATIGILAVATPASAGGGQPACGNTCDHKDPDTYTRYYSGQNYTYTCAYSDNVSTVKSVTTAWGNKLELRYSSYCETTWMRVTHVDGLVDTKMYSTNTDGSVRTTENRPGGGNWSLMLNDHNLLNYACITEYATETDRANGNVFKTTCTGKY